MALAASRTLLALLVTFCALEYGWTAEKLPRPQNGKQTSADEPLRESWEPSIHLDGRPVDRFFISSSKPTRPHRFTKVSKDSRAHPLEDLDPEWVDLDGFAVLGSAPVSNSSAGSSRSSQTTVRNHSTAERTTRVDKAERPRGVNFTRTHRRAPQSSSGPRQPERALTRTPIVQKRHQHNTKPQADQRNQHKPKLTSESVHVVSLQAQKAQGQSAPSNRAVTAKITAPEPPEYEARDINVRVMSPKSVLISWVDPAVEMGKISPGASRSYTVRFREKGESARWEYVTSTQRRMMIETLSADSMYEFSVKISQGEKHSEWSISVFQRTPESAPSGPPENFEVKPLRGKGTAVIATWDPPEEPNGRIKDYILSYAPAMKPFGMKSTTYRGSITTATIDGLTPGERYIFKIRATNRRGMGPQSKAFSVAMPQSSNAASSFTKNKNSQRRSQTASKQDTDQSAEVLEELTTTRQPPPAAPVSRRLRPLSQTRSYHSIFSSVRGSVRNAVSRGSTRTQDEEDEEKEEDKPPTTPSLVEQTTTTEVPNSKEPDNDVSLISEDEVGYEGPMTTETPSLKSLTPSPTKNVPVNPNRPSRRPIKIRVHQKAGSKDTSSSLSKGSDASSSTSTAHTSSVSSSSVDSSSSSSTSLTSSSHNQDPSTNKKDNVVFTYPESKNSYSKPSIAQAEPSTTVTKETNSQQTDSTPVGKGSSTRRSSSAGLRYGYGRRQPGILFRGNSTRKLGGYKPVVSSHLNLPSRTQSHDTSSTRSSAASQSTLAERTGSTLDSQATSDSYTFGKSQYASESNTYGSPALGRMNPSTSQSSAIHPLTGDTGSSHSGSHRSHESTNSHETHISQDTHRSHDQDTPYREGNSDTNFKTTEDSEVTKLEEPTLSTTTKSTKKEIGKEEGNDKSTNEKTIGGHTRISTSFSERFPWLASRYPGRFSSGSRAASPRQDGRAPWTRVSSSVGAGRPLLRGATTRLSGATGATEVSSLQDTTEDLRTPFTNDALKNGFGSGSVKPSTRNPTTSVSASVNSDSHHSSSGHIESSGHVHKETSNVNSNDHNADYLDRRNGESREKVTDPAATQKNPAATSTVQQNAEDKVTREMFPRTNPGTSSGVSPSHRRPGINGRPRSPLVDNRRFGGSRLPIRPQPAQNSRPGASTFDSSTSSSDTSSSSNLPQPVLTSDRDVGSSTTLTKTGGLIGGNSQSTSSSSRDRINGGRPRYPILRGKPNSGGGFKPINGNVGKNGRPNLVSTNEKEAITSHGTNKVSGQRVITGPDGAKWVVDLEQGVLMNQDGQVLQDSQGKPKRVVLGEDGRTIFDHLGSPLVSEEGIALFGHGRESQPVVNPKDKVLMVGGKPVLGLDKIRPRTPSTTTTTTKAPTTMPESTTTQWSSEELSTALAYPTCPPGTFSKIDEYGYPVVDPEGILDCYPEEDSSGMEMDHMLTVSMMPDSLALEKDDMFLQTTLLPSTTTTTTTTIEVPTPEQDTRPFNQGPSSDIDLGGKTRFKAPYVNYIRKDPAAPCSLTEALEYLQVDVLEDLIEKDILAANQNQPPKNKPHNFTVVAMEGCHSFIILDWARPLKDDMVSGYMVYSASYDDVINNKWSSRLSNGTHLPVENLKPNSRYYFKVQAKNVFGLGPFSETLTYVTESDDPLLIERPPGGEPIWVPFSFKYNSAHSSCKGSQYVKRTWYRKFVGVVLCNSLRYKIFMGDGLREPFYSIGDTVGQGEDHCQFVDSYRDGRTGPAYLSNNLPSAQGFYRAYRQEPVNFGVIGRRTPHPFVGWYECGVPIPGKW